MKKKKLSTKGLTFWVCFGQYAGFHITHEKDLVFSICLGRVAFAVFFYDIETTLLALTNALSKEPATNGVCNEKVS